MILRLCGKTLVFNTALAARLSSNCMIMPNSKYFNSLAGNVCSFFNNLERITEVVYLPTETDLLRLRVKTSGLTEVEFKIGENIWR